MSSLGVKTPATCRASFDCTDRHRLIINWLCYSVCTLWAILQHETAAGWALLMAALQHISI